MESMPHYRQILNWWKKLRGFKNGKVGPRTGNSYTGGQYYYLTSLETNIDFNLDAFDITSTLFIDVGSVWGLENPAYSSINDDHEMFDHH